MLRVSLSSLARSANCKRSSLGDFKLAIVDTFPSNTISALFLAINVKFKGYSLKYLQLSLTQVEFLDTPKVTEFGNF